MRYILFLSFILFQYFQSAANAQELIVSNKNNATPRDLIIKVSQFGQFVKRFNYEEDFWGNEISPSFSKKISRQEYIALLFNNQDTRLNNSESPYIKLKQEFINDVTKNKIKTSRVSDSLYSVAICEVLYNNQISTIKIELKQQLTKRGIAWVINDVFAPFFYDAHNDTNSTFFIPPTSNEVNYIHLKKLFDEKDSLTSYAYRGYTCNRLSIFFQLLHSGNIKFNHVVSITYIIADVSNWNVHVKEFRREGDNSGCLIDNISRKKIPVDRYIASVIDEIN